LADFDTSMLVVSALQNQLTELGIDVEIDESLNLLELLDSMDLVNLIMDLEEALESATGHYIALADENTFDAGTSPFVSLEAWKKFVEEKL
jgi:galactitol-specific phosphotransferase system IIB component